MNKNSLCRPFALALVALLPLAMSACSKSVDGKYTGKDGLMTLDFHSGKVEIGGMGKSQTADYTVEGDKVTIKGDKPGKEMVMTIQADGSLEGFGQTFKKAS